MQNHLTSKQLNRQLRGAKADNVTQHLDNCVHCWRKWNKLRWSRAKRSRLFPLLVDYLTYDPTTTDPSWELAKEWNSKARQSDQAIVEFYRNTKWYVPSLFLWKMSGQRPEYVDNALPILKRNRVSLVLDFGAGIGNDTIDLATAGLRVIALEINHHARTFLSRCLQQLELSDKVLVVEDMDQCPESFDALWAMDVVEHLRDPIQTLAPALRQANLFVFDSESTGKSGGRHPFHFQHNSITWRSDLVRFGFAQNRTDDGLNIWTRS